MDEAAQKDAVATISTNERQGLAGQILASIPTEVLVEEVRSELSEAAVSLFGLVALGALTLDTVSAASRCGSDEVRELSCDTAERVANRMIDAHEALKARVTPLVLELGRRGVMPQAEEALAELDGPSAEVLKVVQKFEAEKEG